MILSDIVPVVLAAIGTVLTGGLASSIFIQKRRREKKVRRRQERLKRRAVLERLLAQQLLSDERLLNDICAYKSNQMIIFSRTKDSEAGSHAATPLKIRKTVSMDAPSLYMDTASEKADEQQGSSGIA